MNKKYPFILIVSFFLVPGCASLDEVNQYSGSSAAALNKINGEEYTFSSYCRQDCELQQLRTGVIDTLFKCDCEEAATKADEAIQKIHFTITAYLLAIAQLSDNKSFTYDVSNLTAALQQNPLLQLSDKQVGVYTKAGNFIAQAATRFYRRKKLKQYIEQADPVFQDLTETFIFLIDNRLREQLRLQYEIRTANINQMLSNAGNDKGFKQILIKQYLDERAFYKKNDSLINDYTALLGSVKKGHHDLYLQRNNLKDMKARELIKQCAREVQDIVAGMRKVTG